MNDREERDEEEEEAGRPFSFTERKILREILDNYEHSRWLFMFTMKIAKWIAAIAAASIAYTHFPFPSK